MFKTLVLCLISVLSIPVSTFAQLVLSNPSFEDQILEKEGQSDVNDISGWEASGQSYVQYLDPDFDPDYSTQSLNPHAQDGNNTCGLNEAANEPVYIQQVVKDGNDPVAVEAHKTFRVSVWIGRPINTDPYDLNTSSDPNTSLEVYLKEADSNNKIATAMYDMNKTVPLTWTFQTFRLSTGNHPLGQGSNLILGFERKNTRQNSSWQGQIVIDAISISHADPNIIYVTDIFEDDIPNDQAWIDWLFSEGYHIDARPNYWNAPLDADHQAELQNADLIIVGPGVNPDHYNVPGEADDLWNGIATPLLSLNTQVLSKDYWNWINSDNVVQDDSIPLLELQDANHPVFADILPEESNQVAILKSTVGSGHLSFFDHILDMGNGTLLAQTAGAANTAWIAEWMPDMEFYHDASQFAGGPRMMFSSGTQNDFNLNETGQTLLHNMIPYLISKRKNGPVLELTFDDGTGHDSSGHGRDVDLYGDAMVVNDPERGMVLQLGGTGYASRPLGNNGDLMCRDAVTVAFWIKENASITIPQGIFGNGFYLSNTYAFTVQKSTVHYVDRNTQKIIDTYTYFTWSIRGSSHEFSFAINVKDIPYGTWYHMTFTYDNHIGGQIYLNGELKLTLAASGGIVKPVNLSPDSSTVPHLQGGGVNIGDAIMPESDYPLFSGCLDHIIVYDRVLSSEEIAALAAM